MMFMISLFILQCHKVPLNISNVGYVKDAQQNWVPHEGQEDFEVSSNGIKTAIWVVASGNIRDNMLISYEDLLKFQFIPINFPCKVLTYAVSTNVLESDKHDFFRHLEWQVVYHPNENQKAYANQPNRQNAKPLKVLAARRGYKEPSEGAIEDLIEKGVLKRVTD